MHFTSHAVGRMSERGITKMDIHAAITKGDRWKSKDQTIVFDNGSVRVVIDPLKPAVITAMKVGT